MNLHQKLLNVKKKVPYLQKDKENTHFHYTYISGTKILSELNVLLNEAGVILKTEVLDCRDVVISTPTKADANKRQVLYNLKMRMTWVNTEDPGDIDVNEWWATGCNGEDKGYGSALTYGERYFFLKYFNIPTDDVDPDQIPHEDSKVLPRYGAMHKTRIEDLKSINKKYKITQDRILLGLGITDSREITGEVYELMVEKVTRVRDKKSTADKEFPKTSKQKQADSSAKAEGQLNKP